MEQKFFVCEHCGNIIAMIRDCGVPVYCCGEKMRQIEPGTSEGAGEKHIPMYTVQDGAVTVRIGETDHPMEPEHYIEWVCLETEHGVQYKVLKPGHAPVAHFVLSDGDEVRAAYAFCNLHSLWKQ